MGKFLSRLESVKTLFEIGKLAAETYETYIEGKKTKEDIAKDYEIENLKAENERLKRKLKDTGVDVD